MMFKISSVPLTLVLCTLGIAKGTYYHCPEYSTSDSHSTYSFDDCDCFHGYYRNEHEEKCCFQCPKDYKPTTTCPMNIYDCECIPKPEICLNGFEDLGPAGKCAVLTLDAAKVSLSHGDPTGIFGTACISRNGELDRSGSQVVLGDLLAENPAKIKNNGLGYVQGTIDLNADLSDEKDAALALANNIASSTCDIFLPKKPSSSVSVGDGETVICFNSGAEFQDDFTIVGSSSSTVYVNVFGELKVNGAKVRVGGSLTPSQVIWNIGEKVSFSGGGGGTGCCKAELDGTILAPNGKVSLSPGRVIGSIISSEDISIVSGSVVECPKSKKKCHPTTSPPPPPHPTTSPPPPPPSGCTPCHESSDCYDATNTKGLDEACGNLDCVDGTCKFVAWNEADTCAHTNFLECGGKDSLCTKGPSGLNYEATCTGYGHNECIYKWCPGDGAAH